MAFALDALRPRLRPSLVALVVVTIVAGLIGTPSISATNTRTNGYWIAQALGGVRAFGDAPPLGGAPGRIVVDMATTPTGRGYWLAVSSGQILSIGDARPFVTPSSRRGGPVVAIGARPQGDGVWLLTTDGDLLSYGAAAVFASLNRRLPFIDIAVTPSGGGVWALDIAGGVQVRGDAVAYGNAPGVRLAIAIAPTPSGNGYWVLGTSGAVVALGAAPVIGSASVGVYVDMAVTHSGRGYWLLDVFGRVKTFGDAVHYGDLGAPSFGRVPAVAIAATPFVNLRPIATDDAAMLNEDSSVVVNVLTNDSDPEGDPLAVTITVAPSHGVAAVLAGGIRYTPAANFNGSDQLTYAINDGLGGSASAVVRFTVNAVNDAPSFAKGADQTSAEDAGPQSVSGWASAVSAGPPDESGQTLSFVISNNNDALFSAQPAVSPSGALTYTAAPNASGSATVTVRLQDSGGTANGGVDASGEQTFQITVSPVNDAPTVASPIADQTVNEDAADLVLSLASVFSDVDIATNADSLTLSVAGNTNATLVTTTLLGNSLTLHFAANGNGVADITIRATDGALLFAEDTFHVTVIPDDGGGGTSGFGFGTPIPEIFDFETFNGFPATPGHIGRETLGGVTVEILGPWWLE